MRDRALSPLTFLLIVFCLTLNAQLSYAQKTATSIDVKIGYLNSNIVKMSDPQISGSEQLKAQAEAQINHDLDEANKKLQKLKDEKKPAEEIKKLSEQLQLEMNAKVQAIAQLVQSSNATAQDRLRRIVAEVAKERGLDLVVDSVGVYAGGQKINDSGIDVTNDVVKRLTAGTTAKPATK